jgi:VWFA-related protein
MRSQLVLLLLAVFLSAGLAQEAESVNQLQVGPETPSFEKDVSVRLQLIDVSVLDDGEYVTNLSKDDFIIRVNGEEVDIKTFDAYYSGQSGSIEDLASGMIPDSASPPRRLVLFFDKAYSSYQGFRNAKNAALEFVKRNLSPGDEVMIVSYDRSFKIHTEFTRDREKMMQAIEAMPLSMLGASGRSALFSSENEHNVRVYLQAMQDLSVYLDAWRGRKTFIMFSEGYAQPIALMQLNVYLNEMLEQFSNSNLTIFSIDVAGLGRGRTFSPRLASLRRDTLASFALETGGKFYQGSNNIQKMLLSIDEDISNYYVLGINVPAEQDGSYRDVDIEVKNRDLDLRYSPGFFAPEPFEDMSYNERLIHLVEGFNLPTPIREFDAQFSSGVFPRNDGSAVASVVIKSPIRSSGEQRFEVRGVVSGPDNKLVDGFHKLLEFETDKPTLYHEEYLNLVPGENLIKLVVRDNSTGERCFHFIRARMPKLDDRLRASSILLVSNSAVAGEVYRSNKAKARSFRDEFDINIGKPANPLSIVSASIVIKPDNIVRRGSEQEVVFKVSGVADRKQPDLKLGFKVRDSNGSSYDVPVVSKSLRSVPGTGEAVVLATLNFADIDPGDYVLNTTVEDLTQGSLLGQRTKIKVVNP